ncbi:MAG TPA: ABC transporter ATP-binding protein [Bacteroidia bacterium]
MRTVIKVENLSKEYRLGEVGSGTISRDFNAWLAKLRGKENPNLKIDEITKEYNSSHHKALSDISFDVHEGDVLGIIGKNGAGKSTLLKILSRVTTPSAGSFKVKGRIASLLEVGTGFHADLSGRDNIYLNGAILGMKRWEIQQKFDEIVSFSGVEKFIDTPVKRYSSGMYVRLAFAVAAHLEPEILIVDEVLAVGDAEFQEKCIGKMKDVSSHGRTVLFVSHNLGVINQLCSRAILLKGGKVITDNTTNNVIEEYMSLEKTGVSNEYIADLEKVKDKAMFFREIRTLNSKNESTDRFGTKDNIRFNIKVEINRINPSTYFGIGLLDKHRNRIFTIVKAVSKLISEPFSGTKEFDVEIPSNIIAPNAYSFVFAIFVPKGEVLDVLESECAIKVYDSGSELAIFEGLDYGSVLVDSKWTERKMNVL